MEGEENQGGNLCWSLSQKDLVNPVMFLADPSVAQRQAIYQAAAGNRPTAQQLRPLVTTAESWVKAVTASIRAGRKMGYHHVPVEAKEIGTTQIHAIQDNTQAIYSLVDTLRDHWGIDALPLRPDEAPNT